MLEVLLDFSSLTISYRGMQPTRGGSPVLAMCTTIDAQVTSRPGMRGLTKKSRPKAHRPDCQAIHATSWLRDTKNMIR